MRKRVPLLLILMRGNAHLAMVKSILLLCLPPIRGGLDEAMGMAKSWPTTGATRPLGSRSGFKMEAQLTEEGHDARRMLLHLRQRLERVEQDPRRLLAIKRPQAAKARRDLNLQLRPGRQERRTRDDAARTRDNVVMPDHEVGAAARRRERGPGLRRRRGRRGRW